MTLSVREPVRRAETAIDLSHWQREDPHRIDANLPVWARRTNPIVRRHLGIFWKVMPPDVTAVLRALVFQAAYIVLSLPVPFLFTVLMPTVMVSIVMLPIGLYMYGGALLQIGALAAAHVADERRNNSLDLLRASPIPLVEIVYSKIAAAVWRHSETLAFILSGVALFSLPLLVIQFELTLGSADYPLLMRAAVLLGLFASAIRVILEAIMVAAIGAVVGAASRWRAPAILTTGLLTAAYFALITLARLIPDSPLGILLVEIALPLVAPVIIIAICLSQAARALDR